MHLTGAKQERVPGVPAKRAARPPLVYTGSCGPKPTPEPKNADSPISPKWNLQRVAKNILPDFKSLQKCYSIPRSQTIQVWRSAERNTAAYRGLCTCQSVTACPVCSARIASHRAEELTEAISNHRASGGSCLLLTTTLQHGRDDNLPSLLNLLRDASMSFRSHRSVKSVYARLGLLGSVYALECTYGHGSGFHPHRHTLLFTQTGTISPQDEYTLKAQWLKAVQKHGGTCTHKHGLDIRGGDAAGEYVAKLGLEVALAVRKKGRGENFGVWQLLQAHATGQHWAGRIFKHYAESMKGRTHLKWSRGLRSKLLLEPELTDEEIMSSKADKDETHLCTLTKALWRGVYRNELRGQLLKHLGIGSIHEACALLVAYGLDPSGLTRD